MPATNDQMHLHLILVTATEDIGLSTVRYAAAGQIVNDNCDWGAAEPDSQTESVTLVLYDAENKPLDRALIDSDTWRDIEDNGAGAFYEAVFRDRALTRALEQYRGDAPSI